MQCKIDTAPDPASCDPGTARPQSSLVLVHTATDDRRALPPLAFCSGIEGCQRVLRRLIGWEGGVDPTTLPRISPLIQDEILDQYISNFISYAEMPIKQQPHYHSLWASGGSERLGKMMSFTNNFSSRLPARRWQWQFVGDLQVWWTRDSISF